MKHSVMLCRPKSAAKGDATCGCDTMNVCHARRSSTRHQFPLACFACTSSLKAEAGSDSNRVASMTRDAVPNLFLFFFKQAGGTRGSGRHLLTHANMQLSSSYPRTLEAAAHVVLRARARVPAVHEELWPEQEAHECRTAASARCTVLLRRACERPARGMHGGVARAVLPRLRAVSVCPGAEVAAA